MKVFASVLFVFATEAYQKVPLHQLTKLNAFAEEWCYDHLTAKDAANWLPKFKQNYARLKIRFALCGLYDEQQDCDPTTDPLCLQQPLMLATSNDAYETSVAMRGIKQITQGFSTWATRYIYNCNLQPARQVDRMDKWYGQLSQLINK